MSLRPLVLAQVGPLAHPTGGVAWAGLAAGRAGGGSGGRGSGPSDVEPTRDEPFVEADSLLPI